MRSVYRNAFGMLLLLGTIGISMVPSDSRAQQLGQLTAQQFQADPAQVLANYRTGGPTMISLIRQLAIADHADLALIIGLLATANTDQANAIGTGLGQAALASDQAYAYEIQAALAATNNQTASLAYAAVMGDQAIGATGAGGGGGGGGGGPVNQQSTAGGGGGNTVILSSPIQSTPTHSITSNSIGGASSPVSVGSP